MRNIYKNITENTVILNLLSTDKTSVTSIPLGAGSRVEVENSNLDIYVPHMLARLDESGNDISHSVIQAAAADAKAAEARNEEIKATEAAAKAAAEKAEAKEVKDAAKAEAKK